MPKYRKAPSGEWIGYPELSMEDIDHESFKTVARLTAEAMIEDRMGRVVLRMDHDTYMKFLDAVKGRFGNIRASSVEKAALDAVKAWMQEEGAK